MPHATAIRPGPLTTLVPASGQRPERFPALDGLRGIAILVVALYHYIGMEMLGGPTLLAAPFRMGWAGVDLFFVLSGFLIGGIVLDSRQSSNFYQVFYARRAFRILPLYAIMLGTFLIARVALAGLPMLRQQLPLWSYLTFTQNMALVALSGPGREFQGLDFGTPWLSGTWSLAIEEQFYLVLPLLARLLDRRHLRNCVVGFVLAAPIFRMAAALLPCGALASYVLTPCRADALGLGVLVALAIRNDAALDWVAKNCARLRWATTLGAAGVVYLAAFESGHNSPLMVVVGYTWIAAFCACLLLLVVTHPPKRLAKCLSWPVLRVAGRYSYAIYLLHGCVLHLCFNLFRGSVPTLADRSCYAIALLAAGVTLAIAALSWRFLEGPLLAYAKTWRYTGAACR